MTPASESGFHLDHGGPIICKEDSEKLVFVGIAARNMLSKEKGKPGLFARIFEEKSWIESKIQIWSDWTSCDHTCVQKRAKVCSDTDLDCENGLVTQTQKCPDDQMAQIYEDVNLPWLANGYQDDVLNNHSY